MLMRFIKVFILLLLPLSFFGQVQFPILYTQAGCGNCAYLKTKLEECNISFVERALNSESNAAEMLRALNDLGFKGRILLPVVLFDGALYHPVMEINGEFMHVSLDAALESLSKAYATVEKDDFPEDHVSISANYESGSGDDCLFMDVFYVVCANFEDVNAAKKFARVLKMNGYPGSGYLYYNNRYRVYASTYYYGEEAEAALKDIKHNYRGSYVLTMP